MDRLTYKKQTIMSKAEELIKQEITFTQERTDHAPYVITKLECKILMKLYADEVSREAFDQGYDHALDPNKYYGFDEWKLKEQEEQNG